MDSVYRTVKRHFRHEIEKIRGSRFIATVGQFAGEADLADRIGGLRREFPEANHHCYAWRDGERFRYGDDGEPSGTAGRPMLQQIDGHGLDRVYAVVTRIFGGTKLGAGGLVRAYAAAVREALDRADVVEVVPTTRVMVTIPYALGGMLDSVALARDIESVDSRFTDEVTRIYDVPVGQVASFVEELRERSAGQAEIEVKKG